MPEKIVYGPEFVYKSRLPSIRVKAPMRKVSCLSLLPSQKHRQGQRKKEQQSEW